MNKIIAGYPGGSYAFNNPVNYQHDEEFMSAYNYIAAHAIMHNFQQLEL